MLKLLVFFHYSTSLIWLNSGIIIAASSYFYLSSDGDYTWFVNLIVGIPFMLVTLFFRYKWHLLIQYLTKQKTTSQEKQIKQKLIITKLIGFVFVLSVGLVCLSAVFSRLFIEGMSIFN